MSRRQIFFVEHLAQNQKQIELAFKQIDCPHQLRSFDDGTSLLSYLSLGHQLPDLILLNHHLSLIDGSPVLKTLKEHLTWKFIPVVIWNSQATQEDIKTCYDLGANSYVEKSKQLDRLVVQLETLCSYWFDIALLPKSSLLDPY